MSAMDETPLLNDKSDDKHPLNYSDCNLAAVTSSETDDVNPILMISPEHHHNDVSHGNPTDEYDSCVDDDDPTGRLISSKSERMSAVSILSSSSRHGDGGAGSGSSPSRPGFVFLLTFFAAIGGFLFGYDTGVVSGALLPIRVQFSLDRTEEEVFVSATIGTAAVFALVGGVLNDRLGRRPTILLASLVFTIGAVVIAAAPTGQKWVLILGRAILGIGIGFASTTIPMYIAETTPMQLRGRLVTLYQMAITIGLLVSGLVDGAFCYVRANGWRYMLGLAAVPAIVQFIGFLFMPETPRWLISKGRVEQATKVLQKIRSTEDVEEEVEAIIKSCAEDRAELAAAGDRPVFILAFTSPGVRKALFLGCGIQIFQQLSGINTVMYYSATIVHMSGVSDECTAIWWAAAVAFANFVFTFLGIYLVERIGRRPLILASLAGVIASLLFLAMSFHLAVGQYPAAHYIDGNPTQCSTEYRSCGPCMEDDSCGFCYVETAGGSVNGSCLMADPSTKGHSTSGRCASFPDGTASSVKWAYDFCPTSISWMSVLGMVFYLACFAPGMGPMPWTINSEIYPMWARSFGNSLATFSNWAANLIVSMTFLTLTHEITRYGTFYLYAGIAALGFVFIFFRLPETKGKTLEEIELIFSKNR